MQRRLNPLILRSIHEAVKKSADEEAAAKELKLNSSDELSQYLQYVNFSYDEFKALSVNDALKKWSNKYFMPITQKVTNFSLTYPQSSTPMVSILPIVKPQNRASELATGEGIYKALVQRLGNKADVVKPTNFAIHSPFDLDPEKAKVGIHTFLTTLCGYSSKDGEYIDNGLIRSNKGLLKPIVAIINTASVSPLHSRDTGAIGGAHWITIVIVPKKYRNTKNKLIKNKSATIYLIDSMNPNFTFPPLFKKALLEGSTLKSYVETSEKDSTLIERIEKVTTSIRDINFGTLPKFKQQQFDTTSCGYFAVHNAVSIVEEGSAVEIIKQSQTKMDPAKLRELYPDLNALNEQPLLESSKVVIVIDEPAKTCAAAAADEPKQALRTASEKLPPEIKNKLFEAKRLIHKINKKLERIKSFIDDINSQVDSLKTYTQEAEKKFEIYDEQLNLLTIIIEKVKSSDQQVLKTPAFISTLNEFEESARHKEVYPKTTAEYKERSFDGIDKLKEELNIILKEIKLEQTAAFTDIEPGLTANVILEKTITDLLVNVPSQSLAIYIDTLNLNLNQLQIELKSKYVELENKQNAIKDKLKNIYQILGQDLHIPQDDEEMKTSSPQPEAKLKNDKKRNIATVISEDEEKSQVDLTAEPHTIDLLLSLRQEAAPGTNKKRRTQTKAVDLFSFFAAKTETNKSSLARKKVSVPQCS